MPKYQIKPTERNEGGIILEAKRAYLSVPRSEWLQLGAGKVIKDPETGKVIMPEDVNDESCEYVKGVFRCHPAECSDLLCELKPGLRRDWVNKEIKNLGLEYRTQ